MRFLHKTFEVGAMGVLLAGLVTSAATGCSILGGDDDGETGETGDGDGDGDGDGETGGIPDEGFRVFPKFRLVDVSAVVTIEVDLMPVGCPYDDGDGGYVCDTSDVADATATIRVERDGFDPAERHPTISPGQLADLDVHLAEEGGATGTWSDCVAVGDALTCDDVCENAATMCVPVSCDTEDPEWPLATSQAFGEADCAGDSLDDAAVACNAELPDASGDAVSLRCCCAG